MMLPPDPGRTEGPEGLGKAPRSPVDRHANAIADPIRLERDRHVAFAFAAADLLIETDADGLIASVSGAAKSIVGRSSRDLTGGPIDAVIARADQALIRGLLRRIRDIGRIDPVPVTLVRVDQKSARVLFGGCRLPTLPGRLFISVTLLPTAMAELPRPRDAVTGLLTEEALRAMAERSAAAEAVGRTQLTLVDLEGLSGAARQLAPDRSAMLMEEIGASLRAQSLGGDGAGRLGDDAFGIVTNAGVEQAKLLDELTGLIRSAGVRADQVVPHSAQVDLATAELDEREVSRAIAYIMKRFSESHGADFPYASLESGLAASFAETVARVEATRQIIDGGAFNLVYQPIVELSTRTVHHYETLSRFHGSPNVLETIVFSEDMALIQELDLAVCRRAIDALNDNPTVRLAVNMSGQSIQNNRFRQALGDLVRPLDSLRGRLLFELTESAAVQDLEDAAIFLRWLRQLGHPVCIDDFGAGAAAYSYLRRFDVDFVKIDGPFLKAAAGGGRERALVRSICVLAKEIGCRIIGEMIEDEKAADLSLDLGIELGQGWLFGKPLPKLPIARPAATRRKAVVATWQ